MPYSLTTRLNIACDSGDCQGARHKETGAPAERKFYGMTQAGALAQARHEGWSLDKFGVTFCPACTEARWKAEKEKSNAEERTLSYSTA